MPAEVTTLPVSLPWDAGATLRLRQELDVVDLAIGQSAVWTPAQADYRTMDAPELAFLKAFGEGGGWQEAAGRAGLAGTRDWEAVAGRLAAELLLEPVADDPVRTDDPQNARSRIYFQQNARSWSRSAYSNADAGAPFAVRRSQLARTWIERLAGDARKTILDVGCGPGELAIELARAGHRVQALDSAEGMIELAREALAKETPEVRSRVLLATGQLEEHRTREPVDIVVALGVLPFFGRPELLFQAGRRLVRDRGAFIVNGPNKLVSRRGPRWLPWTRASLLERLAPLRRMASIAPPSGWEGLAGSLSSALEGSRALLAQPASERPATGATRSSNPRETSLHPAELERLAARHGFALEALCGTGFLRTPLDDSLPTWASDALLGPLDVLCELPISLLWTTGFLGVLRASA